jgi:hypothetical protein
MASYTTDIMTGITTVVCDGQTYTVHWPVKSVTWNKYKPGATPLNVLYKLREAKYILHLYGEEDEEYQEQSHISIKERGTLMKLLNDYKATKTS